MRIVAITTAALLGCVPFSAWSSQNIVAAGDLIFTTRAESNLSGFVRQVLQTNPQLQAAAFALRSSRALESAAGRPLYNPELEADYEDAADNTWQVGLGQSLDWAGKREARSSVAQAERRALKAQYLFERREFIAKLLSGLGFYQNGAQRVALATERLEAMVAFADLARRRFETGDINQVETDLAALAAMDARIQRARAGADLAEALQAVRSQVTNVPVERWPEMTLELPTVEAISDPQTLVVNLPEVQAAQRRVDAADAAVELSQLQRKPDPTLSVRGGQEGDSTLVGVNVSIPLYVRNSFADEVTAAIAERDQAQQLADDLYRRSYTRFQGATERYRLTLEAWRNWEATGRPSLRSQSDVLHRLWEAGEISTTDYLVQLRQTLDTRENALDLELALWRAWFEWLAASGKIDAWLGLEGES